jgi:hypothetical protein
MKQHTHTHTHDTQHTQTHRYFLSDQSNSICLLLPVRAYHVGLYRRVPSRYLQPGQELLSVSGRHGKIVHSVIFFVIVYCWFLCCCDRVCVVNGGEMARESREERTEGSERERRKQIEREAGKERRRGRETKMHHEGQKQFYVMNVKHVYAMLQPLSSCHTNTKHSQSSIVITATVTVAATEVNHYTLRTVRTTASGSCWCLLDASRY